MSNSYVKTEGMVVDLKDANDAKNQICSFYNRPPFGLKKAMRVTLLYNGAKVVLARLTRA